MTEAASVAPWVQLLVQVPALGAVWLFYSELKAFRSELGAFRVELQNVNASMIELLSDTLGKVRA